MTSSLKLDYPRKCRIPGGVIVADSLAEALHQGGLIFDGAMGTELVARGLDVMVGPGQQVEVRDLQFRNGRASTIVPPTRSERTLRSR